MKTKRILSVALAIVMLFGVLGASQVFAADTLLESVVIYPTSEEVEYEFYAEERGAQFWAEPIFEGGSLVPNTDVYFVWTLTNLDSKKVEAQKSGYYQDDFWVFLKDFGRYAVEVTVVYGDISKSERVEIEVLHLLDGLLYEWEYFLADCENDFTPESWAVFAEACKKGEALAADKNATTAQKDAAANALQQAYDDLQWAEQEEQSCEDMIKGWIYQQGIDVLYEIYRGANYLWEILIYY